MPQVDKLQKPVDNHGITHQAGRSAGMTETQEQKQLVEWFRSTFPQHAHLLRVSMSGLNLGSGKRAAIMVNFMRSMGINTGEADIAILLPRHGFGSLVIEFKGSDGCWKVTKEQSDYLEAHRQSGNCAMVVKGLQSAKDAISSYMGIEETITDADYPPPPTNLDAPALRAMPGI